MKGHSCQRITPSFLFGEPDRKDIKPDWNRPVAATMGRAVRVGGRKAWGSTRLFVMG